MSTVQALGAVALLVAALGVLGWVLPERLRRPMDDAARAMAPGAFAALRSGCTHFRWDGPSGGPVVVCIHGASSGAYVWDPLAGILTHMGFRVLRYDLYGRGFSDRPKGAQDRAFFLAQLQQLLDHQGVRGTVTLIGHSLGGAIATAFAAANPAQVERLVLIAPAGLGADPGPFARFVAGVPVLGDIVLRVAGGWAVRRDSARTAALAPADRRILVQQAAEAEWRGFLPALLSSLRHLLAEEMAADHRRIAARGVPVLAVWGADDRLVPIGALGRLAQVNRDARQEVVRDAGHGVVHTHPEAIRAALQGFLREI